MKKPYFVTISYYKGATDKCIYIESESIENIILTLKNLDYINNLTRAVDIKEVDLILNDNLTSAQINELKNENLNLNKKLKYWKRIYTGKVIKAR